MAHVLPILRNTTGTLNAQVLYGFSRSVSFMTRVTINTNGSEQRWPCRAPMYEFTLPMNNLLVADKSAWLTFFNSVVGRFSTDLELSIGATVYDNLTLLADDLTVSNSSSLIYNQAIKLRQVMNPGWTAPTAGTMYPTFSFGAVAEMPFVQSSCYYTAVNDNPYGPAFTWKWYDAGLTNFPTTYLKMWKISYPLISDTDLSTLEAFFTNQQGRLASFSFTDPTDGNTYSHVRFDMDSLDIRYITKNQNATVVQLRQTFNS